MIGEGQSDTASRVEVGVVVSRYAIFVRMGECRVAVNGCLEFCRSAMVGYVASVNEDVAFWDVARIERVHVRYADYSYGGRVLRTCAAKGEKKGRQAEKEMQWLVEDGVDKAWAIEERQLWGRCIQSRPLGGDLGGHGC